MQKMSVRYIPIYPANLATFQESWIFGAPKGDMKYLCPTYLLGQFIYFMPNIYFSTLRIFYVEMATSEGGGGGLHNRSWETTKLKFYFSFASADYAYSMYRWPILRGGGRWVCVSLVGNHHVYELNITSKNIIGKPNYQSIDFRFMRLNQIYERIAGMNEARTR